MMYLSIFGEQSIVTHTALSSLLSSLIVPVPSICPDTICPPNLPPAAMARSRFTLLPPVSCPSPLRLKVSGMTSAVKIFPDMPVAVRHTPFTAILSPTWLPWRTLSACTVMLQELTPLSIFLIVPISSTIPVNMYDLFSISS